MESLSFTDAKAFVRKAMAEIQANDASFDTYDTDSSDLNDIIKAKMVEAVEFVHKNAPLHLIGKDAVYKKAADVDEACVVEKVHLSVSDKVLTIDVPDKVMRFISFKATDGKEVVYEALLEDNPEAKKQKDSYACGTYQKPVIVYCLREAQYFKYYSLATTIGNNEVPKDRLSWIAYLPFPALATDTVQICASVKLAILNHLTGLVLLVMQEQHAEDFFNLAKAQMQ